MVFRHFIAALVATILFNCTSIAAQAQTVLAATDVQVALDKIVQRMPRRMGLKPAITYGASADLARQIESGAPADVFFSADVGWMDYLQDRKLIKSEMRGNLLRNRLAYISRKESRTAFVIRPNARLDLGNAPLVMPNFDSVPAGQHAKAALKALGAWAVLSPNVVQTADARGAIQMVLRGDVGGGIVYHSDAAADRKVRVVWRFPESSHLPILYPIAVTASSTNAETLAFIRYLSSPEAQRVWERQGFTLNPMSVPALRP